MNDISNKKAQPGGENTETENVYLYMYSKVYYW